ncbi:MAG TPA: phage holin family protein [Candidatus Xenobia bacterium]|jgi:putative membrane protein
MRILLHWLVNALCVYIVAQILPGFVVAGFGSALVVALVFGILSVVLGPLLQILGTVVTLPLVIGTFGLFFFVIRFLVYLFLLSLTAHLVGGFYIATTGALVIGAVLLSVLHHIAAMFFQPAR